jgi:hypothetical protein
MTTPAAEQRARGGVETQFTKTRSMGKIFFCLSNQNFSCVSNQNYSCL